jgi:hypothetical protein
MSFLLSPFFVVTAGARLNSIHAKQVTTPVNGRSIVVHLRRGLSYVADQALEPSQINGDVALWM